MIILRWWLYAWTAQLATLLLSHVASLEPGLHLALLTLAFLCGCSALYFVARGLLCVHGKHPLHVYVPLAVGCALLLAFQASSTPASPDLLLPIICGFIGIGIWSQRADFAKSAAVLSIALLLISACGLIYNAVVCQVFPQPTLQNLMIFAPPGRIAWWSLEQCAALLAMAHVTLIYARKRDAELHIFAERTHRLLDSTSCGVCEVDSDGMLTFINRAASQMFAVDEQSPASLTIYDFLKPPDAESLHVFREHFLRPDAPVESAKAHLRRTDGSVSPVEWCSSPLLRDGTMTGTVLTFRDISEREAEDRFAKFSSEVLQLIVQNKSTEESLRLLAAAVELRLEGFYCSVLVNEGDSFRVAAAPSLPDALHSAINGLPCETAVPCANPLEKQRSCRRLLQELAGSYGFKGTWIETIVSPANEVLGTMLLNREDTEPLSPDQRNILKEAARLGALAIEHRHSFERLLHQGHHDPLTGLPNRLLLEDRLKQALARAERKHSQIALLCIDLDRFKNINDTFGHDTGDLFLQQISVRLASRIRASDTLARTGGDEFTAILAEISAVRDAEKVAGSLLESLREPFEVDGHTLYGGASIGIAVYPQDGKDAVALHRTADRAMYRAKSQGGNATQCSRRDDGPDNNDRLELETHLHRAIEQGNFSLYFQPQYTCDRQLAGFEALLRFRHPKLGMVPPSKFIPIAEESGLILPIGEWVLRTACRQIAEWVSKGMSPLRVAVNVSPLQFAQPDFVDTVLRALKESQVRPDLLELELTEGVLMQNLGDSARQMRMLSEIGVNLSVDDFGTGYSSLSYLHQLPIHLLKIDRSFIAKMLEQSGTRPIVDAIISLAHGLGLRTVAEGVENEQQLAALQAADCDLVQGFYFSYPLSVVDASRLLWQEHKRASRNEPLRFSSARFGTGT